MLTALHHLGPMKPQTPRAKADELRRNGRFEEAATEYASIWPDGDQWTGWGYAHCLRKLGRFPEALEVARVLYKLDPTFQACRSVYAWVIYDGYVRGTEKPETNVIKAATAIVRLMNSHDQAYAPSNPLAKTVLHVAKLWCLSGRDTRALEWLDKLTPERLQTKTFTFKDNKGRQRELASDLERYYGIRTRALERLGRWQECLNTAILALTKCVPLHHDNDIWFPRRIALAKINLGLREEGLSELQQLVSRKPTSFMHADIAVAAWEMGNPDLSFKHALQALLTTRDISFALQAARVLAEVLWRRGEKEYARKHIHLCISVRSQRGWKASEALTKLAIEWEATEQEGDSPALTHELRQLWKSWREDASPRLTGTITRLLPNGHAGFIQTDSRGDFYFSLRDWQDRERKPEKGSHVTFATRAGFDRKRQRATTEACEVRAALTASSVATEEAHSRGSPSSRASRHKGSLKA